MRKNVISVLVVMVILIGFLTLAKSDISIAAESEGEQHLSLSNKSHLFLLNNRIIKAKDEVHHLQANIDNQEPEVEDIETIEEEAPQFITPAEGRLTSAFGYRIHPIFGDKRFHQGIDLAKSGKVEILAAADGVVTKSQELGSYGQVIMIEHHLDDEVYETVYAHLRDDSRKVSVGDKVEQGQLIGLQGNTGNSTGQHLHFETHEGKWKKGQPNAVDPLDYIEIKAS